MGWFILKLVLALPLFAALLFLFVSLAMRLVKGDESGADKGQGPAGDPEGND